MQERREDYIKMKETIERLDVGSLLFSIQILSLKISINLTFQSIQKDFQEVSLALDGERYRAERLEEQVNDLTELHQVIKPSIHNDIGIETFKIISKLCIL